MQEGKSASFEDYTSYIKYFVFILALDALSVIPFARVRAEGRAMRYALIKFINIASFICLNLFFLFAIPYIIQQDWGIAAWISTWYRSEWIGYVFISNLIASSLTFLLLMPELFKLQLRIDTKLLLNMFSYSWPVLIANLSFIVNENSDKIFLENLLPADISERQVGIYGACTKLAVFLSIFINAFRLGAEPFFFNTSKDKNAKETYASIMSYFVMALCLVYVGLVANIDLLKYFIGESYWEGIYVVPILLLGYLNLGIYMNLSIWYKLSDQTKYGLYISGIGALATIVLNILFIPQFGYVASAWISLIVYTLMMLLSYLWGQKHYPIPYKVKRDLLYIILATALVYISFWVFNRNIVVGNILFVSFCIFIFYLERQNLKALIGKS
ncbi:polysaccharide biosynthesis protein [Pseudoxanthomonas sp. SGD-10]|nr:polysaccharide biosynthesis protein [Pseudoxanthomonas sp. SGD-10]